MPRYIIIIIPTALCLGGVPDLQTIWPRYIEHRVSRHNHQDDTKKEAQPLQKPIRILQIRTISYCFHRSSSSDHICRIWAAGLGVCAFSLTRRSRPLSQDTMNIYYCKFPDILKSRPPFNLGTVGICPGRVAPDSTDLSTQLQSGFLSVIAYLLFCTHIDS